MPLDRESFATTESATECFFNDPTTHLCQAASGKNSAALSASPMQASEVISRTPVNPRFEMLEERAPTRLILLRPLANAENLPITALVHADRNQQ
jgi:hypothetical protein